MFWNGSTAIDGLSGNASAGRFRGRRRLRLCGDADLERISPDRFGDVLQLRLPEIGDLQIEPRPHLPIRVLGKTNRAGLGDPLQPRGDVDAVAHQVAVALLDDIAQVDADAELDALIRRDSDVALDHRVLNLDSAAHGLDHAAKFDQRPVARALEHSAIMAGDRGIDEIGAQRPQPRKRTVFVRARHPTEADDVGGEDRRDFPSFGHSYPAPFMRIA